MKKVRFGLKVLIFSIILLGVVGLVEGAVSGVKLNKVNFPDVGFRKMLKEMPMRVDRDNDGIITKKELGRVQCLDFYSKDVYNIKSIKGIEFFPNIKTFSLMYSLEDNQVDLSKNKNIQNLFLANIDSMDNVKIGDKDNILSMQLTLNKEQYFDATPYKNLQLLRLNGNIADFDISKNLKLTSFGTTVNSQMTSIIISKNKSLETIDLNSLSNLKTISLSKVYRLNSFRVRYADKLTTISISKCKKLKTLELPFNKNIKNIYVNKNTKIKIIASKMLKKKLKINGKRKYPKNVKVVWIGNTEKEVELASSVYLSTVSKKKKFKQNKMDFKGVKDGVFFNSLTSSNSLQSLKMKNPYLYYITTWKGKKQKYVSKELPKRFSDVLYSQMKATAFQGKDGSLYILDKNYTGFAQFSVIDKNGKLRMKFDVSKHFEGCKDFYGDYYVKAYFVTKTKVAFHVSNSSDLDGTMIIIDIRKNDLLSKYKLGGGVKEVKVYSGKLFTRTSRDVIFVQDVSTGELLNSIKMPKNPLKTDTSLSCMDINGDTIYYANRYGVFKVKILGEKWTKVMNKKNSSYIGKKLNKNDLRYELCDIIVANNNKFYLLFKYNSRYETKYKLAKYKR